ncbi:efflux RND transporter periplasmic adaptor subunit [Roseateles chitinivorans]|uniref:efflux RND transporter periplasmic adaptor subunit n=1 Tax=Roseateles chitinivorans TaxID=2917965 RepID=UPI003D66B53C
MNFNKQDDKTSSGRGLPKRQLIAIAVLVALGLIGGAAILASGPAGSAKGGHGEHAEAGHDDHGHDGEKDAGRHQDQEKNQEKGPEKGEHKDDHAGEARAARPGDAHQAAAAGGKAAEKEDGHGHAAGEPEAIAMTGAQIKSAAIALEVAGPATIRTTTRLPGEIGFNEDRTAHVVPRVSGVVEAVPATLGQAVRKGDLLAVIASAQVSDQRSELLAAQKREQLARTTFDRERKLWEEKISPRQDVDVAEQALREAEIAVANARQKLLAIGATPGGGALTRFELRAPFDGVVVEKHLTLGEQVKEDASVFVLSDLRTVWARLDVPAGDLTKVRVGERAIVRSAAFEQAAEGTVAYVGALIGGQSRTAQARISLANPDRAWRPGLFVNVDVVTGEAPAAVTVAADAVQVFEDRQVVFVRTADGFAATPVKTGRGDGRRIEIVDGLKAGAKVAAVNAFVIKSEAGKGSATHSH